MPKSSDKPRANRETANNAKLIKLTTAFLMDAVKGADVVGIKAHAATIIGAATRLANGAALAQSAAHVAADAKAPAKK